MDEVWLVWRYDSIDVAPYLEGVWDSESAAVAHLERHLGAERERGETLWIVRDPECPWADDVYAVERRRLLHGPSA